MTDALQCLRSRVLVANRGEIAVRVIRTLRSLGIGSVAVYSDADAEPRTCDADVAVRLGPAAATESYLDVDRVIAAALATGAPRRSTPGTGSCRRIPPFAARLRRDRDRLRRTARGRDRSDGGQDLGEAHRDRGRSPRRPGSRRSRADDDDRRRRPTPRSGCPCCSSRQPGEGARACGWSGRRRVRCGSSRRHRTRPRNAFGDDTPPRRALRGHARATSRSRSSPTPTATSSTSASASAACSVATRRSSRKRRRRSLDAAPCGRRWAHEACDAARACGYVGAGTVEFIVSGDRPDDVLLHGDEHAAAGRAPGHGADVTGRRPRGAAAPRRGRRAAAVHAGRRRPPGHAIEARVYAEDPSRGFLPSGGTILAASRAAPSRPECGSTPACCEGTDHRFRLRPHAGEGDRPRRTIATRPSVDSTQRRHRTERARCGPRTWASCGGCSPMTMYGPAASTPGSSSAGSRSWPRPTCPTTW